MSVELDLRQRAWTQRRGNVTVIGTWIGKDGDFQPCMVLIRTGDDYNPDLVPCAIPLEEAWMWSEEVGDGRRSFHAAMQFAQVMRLGDNGYDIRRIAGIIHDHLGDLVSMRPYQTQEKKPVVAEVTMVNHQTGKPVDVELRDV